MSSPPDIPADLARYRPQVLLDRIGVAGQQQLRHAAVTLVGCGALGSVLASTLARAGVGHLRIIDRDFIELDNLQRQVLFDEQDLAENLPKAEAAARKLRRANSGIEVVGTVADLNPASALALCADADLLLDGTDNLETRYLLNDVAVKLGVPWIYAACIATEGVVLPVLPHRTPCLRCLWDEPPAPGALPTCDTAGVLATAAGVVASIAATEALKILIGREAELAGGLLAVDVWRATVRRLDVRAAREPGTCPCCQRGSFEFLEGGRASASAVLCGRNAVQILPAEGAAVDLKAVARRLPAHMRPKLNEFLLRFRTDEHVVALFRDGRAIVQGTSDPAAARAVYAKYIGA